MNRSDLQRLSRIRLREARILLNNRSYEGAYYLLGYAVECAFKACIARRTRRYDFPDRKFAVDIYTHDLSKLLNLSGLEPEHRRESIRNPIFELNWTIVKDWSEQLVEGTVFCHGYRSGGEGSALGGNDCRRS